MNQSIQAIQSMTSKQPTYAKLKESTATQELAFIVDYNYQNDPAVLLPIGFTVNYKRIRPRKLKEKVNQFLEEDIILDINAQLRSIKWNRKSHEHMNCKDVKDAMFWIKHWKTPIFCVILATSLWSLFLLAVFGSFVLIAFSTSLFPLLVYIVWHCDIFYCLYHIQWKLITMNNEKFEKAVIKLNEKYKGKMKIILGVSQISKPILCKPSSQENYIKYQNCQVLIYNQNYDKNDNTKESSIQNDANCQTIMTNTIEVCEAADVFQCNE